MQTAEFLTALSQLIGPSHVLQAPIDIEPFCLDLRQRYHGRPLAVALPGSRQEVAALVRLASQAGIALLPQGGNTSTCGAATPDDSGRTLVVGLRRLDRVIEVDAANNSMTLEAGVTLARAQQIAAEADRLFPLSLASEGSCQIGGNLATNAGGLAVLRYGTMRDLALGLEVVLPDGRVLNQLSGLRKDTSGLDLKQLFIGSEGQLGLITAATLKVFPMPRARATAMVGVADAQTAIDWLAALRDRFADRLTTFEMMSGDCMALLQQYQGDKVPFIAPWTLLIELSDSEGQQALEDQLVQWLSERDMLDGVIAQSETERLALWQLREDMSETQKRRGPSIKHDIGLPSSAIPAFLTQCGEALQRAYPGCSIMAFGHAGDGNLHYNVSYTRPDNAELFADEENVNRIVYDTVYRLNGTLAAEHGIGQLKTHWLETYKDPLALSLMRSVKKLLDPENRMNPGKWLSD
ncbi:MULTISPECIES: FAD-binding oxidoreductase [unclassified Paludibacterium]|uniref:FAD-binding oxidoreductase n=1 Tax=unclassified Paludibacterium TaxID=2618429 RepID=UPI001C05466C|nr:FAD-binding oxidoreductase [Paludibacterium sp. B53371]BEV73248.1 FAD-binding oxidoreductase [Paludibacterium sp. THUN1379]